MFVRTCMRVCEYVLFECVCVCGVCVCLCACVCVCIRVCAFLCA